MEVPSSRTRLVFAFQSNQVHPLTLYLSIEQEPFFAFSFVWGFFGVLFGFGTFLNHQANITNIDLDQHCPIEIRFQTFLGATFKKQKEL